MPLLEISDLIVDFDLATLRRLPVDRQEVVRRLLAEGDRFAARVVQRLPATDEVLDADAVDRLLIRVHCEMQRLSEEFQHGRRVLELLGSLLAALRAEGVAPPYRIVDIGCGTGYVIRWLAAHGGLGRDVELLGVDFNGALIAESQRLAEVEQLDCGFATANAFTLKAPATIFLSTGVLHHFRGDGLANFFRQHDQPAAQAFAHFDFQPTVLARPGAWLFHFVRMREPLARHDGVVSARRAHSARDLLAAARQPSFRCGMYSARMGRLPLPRVFHTVLGVRPRLVEALRESLGRRVGRLEAMQ